MHLSGLAFHQLRPNAAPGFLAERSAVKFAASSSLKTPSLGRTHVAPTREALIEVLLADPVSFGQMPPSISANFGGHSAQCSDSLGRCLATRYVTVPSGSLDNRMMETAADRRKRKLKELCSKHGMSAVAGKAGVSAAYLDQIIKGVKLQPKADGTRSVRSLGDKLARAIEDAYELGAGWFDTPENATDKSIAIGALDGDEEDLVLSYRKLPPDLQQKLVRGLMTIALRHDSAAAGELAKRQLIDAAADETVAKALAEANSRLHKQKTRTKEGATSHQFDLAAKAAAKKRSVAK